jgi:cell division protein FtsI (penicillin-binding protein 3)
MPQRVVSARTAQELTRSLTAVVDHGTGRQAAIAGYAVAGKTGTAWKAFDDGSGKITYGSNGNRRYIVSFAGFLPADEPRLSMVIVVDEPVTETTASAVAAPIFAEIGAFAARTLLVPPDQVTGVDGVRVRGEPAAGLLAASGSGGEMATVGTSTSQGRTSGAGPVELAAGDEGGAVPAETARATSTAGGGAATAGPIR